MRRLVVPALVTALGGLALAGCSSSDEWRVRESGDLLVLIAPEADGGDAAELLGDLVEVDGCLGVLSDEGEAYVVGWPSSTSVASDDPPQVWLDRHTKIGVGDQVALGGGFHPPGEVEEVPVPASCADDVIFIAASATVARE